MIEIAHLWKLYLTLIGWVGLGLILGHRLPKSVPLRLGKFLFWVGVPLSIMAFLRQADLSASVWAAPLTAWVAMLLGASLAWLWIKLVSAHSSRNSQPLQPPTQGSFLLATMVGNTGYIGYPVALALVGPQYFGWAVFYDTLGSTLGAYGLGVVLAAYFGRTADSSSVQPIRLLQALIQNPALWSFWIGLGLRSVSLPAAGEQSLKAIAWTVVALSLVLLGMRLGQITSWQNLRQASVSLAIKMLLIPLLIGISLPSFGISGLPRLTIVLQVAMPPAFATLVLAEAYNLNRELTVTTLALGSVLLLLILPIWLALFAP
jgi:predicted permease